MPFVERGRGGTNKRVYHEEIFIRVFCKWRCCLEPINRTRGMFTQQTIFPFSFLFNDINCILCKHILMTIRFNILLWWRLHFKSFFCELLIECVLIPTADSIEIVLLCLSHRLNKKSVKPINFWKILQNCCNYSHHTIFSHL